MARWAEHGASYYLPKSAAGVAPMFLNTSDAESAEYRDGLAKFDTTNVITPPTTAPTIVPIACSKTGIQSNPRMRARYFHNGFRPVPFCPAGIGLLPKSPVTWFRRLEQPSETQ